MWASLIAQLVKNPPAMQETPVRFLGGEDLLKKGSATHSSILGLPCGSAGKESTCNVRDLDTIPGLGTSPGEGKGYPLQYSGLENSMDCIAHGVTNSWTWLSDFQFNCPLGFLFHQTFPWYWSQVSRSADGLEVGLECGSYLKLIHDGGWWQKHLNSWLSPSQALLLHFGIRVLRLWFMDNFRVYTELLEARLQTLCQYI